MHLKHSFLSYQLCGQAATVILFRERASSAQQKQFIIQLTEDPVSGVVNGRGTPSLLRVTHYLFNIARCEQWICWQAYLSVSQADKWTLSRAPSDTR